MSIKISLIETGTILSKTHTGIFSPTKTTTLLVISKKDVVTSSGKPGLEITYLEETRELEKKYEEAMNEFVVKSLHKAYDITHPKQIVFEIRGGDIDSIVYDFCTIIPSEELSKLADVMMYRPISNIISFAKNAIDNIPIQFKVTDIIEDSKVKFELDSHLLTEEDTVKSIINIIDPMFFDNNKYSCIGTSKADALLKFRTNLENHIHLLKFILHRADEEWENFNDHENSPVDKDDK